MMSDIKLPPKELIIASFCGGITMSLLELMNMFAAHENVFDPYFWGGAFIAGLVGIIGLFVSRAKDIGGAITSGIAAPQILGGMTKIVPTTLALISLHASPSYANMSDSISVTTIVEGTYKVLEIKPINSNRGILLRDTTIIKIPINDSLEIIGDQYETIHFSLNKDTVKNEETILKIKATNDFFIQRANPVERFLRGAFGHSHRKEKIKKLELSIEKKIIEEE